MWYKCYSGQEDNKVYAKTEKIAHFMTITVSELLPLEDLVQATDCIYDLHMYIVIVLILILVLDS